MSWIGYWEYGGTELINAARVERYASVLGAFKAVYHADALGPMLGEVYDSPMQDDAPWTDPDNLDTYDFLGVYPLDVTGVDDSTFTAPVTESTRNGGNVGMGRYGTKALVFSVALIGRTDAAVSAGLRWLKEVLTGPACGNPGGCGGYELCFLDAKPQLDWSQNSDPTVCLDPYLRSLHDVAVTVAPTVNSKVDFSQEGSAMLVSFTLVASNPFTFGVEVPIVAGFMDEDVTVPYVGGVVPDGGSFDVDGFIQTEQHCSKARYSPVVDPLCAQTVSPPTPPNIALACYQFPVNYVRRQIVLPPGNVPVWGEVVPRLQIKAGNREVRNLRMRLYADPFETGDPNDDPCNYCGDVVFSYIPANATLIFDGVDEIVYVEDPVNGKRRADALVYATDGSPFDWPSLSCGFGYIATFDMPQNSVQPVVNISLFSRTG